MIKKNYSAIFTVCIVAFAMVGWAADMSVTNSGGIQTNTYPEGYKSAYVRTVTRGEGWAPGQKRESVSPEEREFRARMEERKTQLLTGRIAVKHPVTLTEEQVDRARQNIKNAAWAAEWFAEQKTIADFLLAQAADYVERMIPDLTPTSVYGFSCPRCVGKRSGEGLGVFRWDYQNPDVICCDVCGQALPDPAYPETGVLVCPRRGQTFTYYRNEAQRAHPDDLTGKYAWIWAYRPLSLSFTGIVRERKVRFMFYAAKASAQVYRLTGDARYAELAVRILQCLARRFPNWLYHDFYGTFADCDPLYAAARDTSLKLEFKRHPYEMAYGGSTYETGSIDDTPEKAKMLTTFFGAGRIFPSACSMSLFLGAACETYDLTYDAKGTDGQALWSDEARMDVESNLILEYTLEAEPWLGGPQNTCNLAPFVYQGLAAVGTCLGMPDYAHVALKGYETVRDSRFLYDGMSSESALYTDAFLFGFMEIAELLQGYRWPKGFKKRTGIVDIYGSDAKMKAMLQTSIEQLRPNGMFLPLSDTISELGRPKRILEIAARRYPDFVRGRFPFFYENGGDDIGHVSYKGYLLAQSGMDRARTRSPTTYALFNLDVESFMRKTPYNLPEIFFPAWMTAILRHGQGPEATDLALAFNPGGTHRHSDNLSLYYSAYRRAVLGDLGYMADTPFLGWFSSSFSHNLVVVDDAGQLSAYAKGDQARRPALRWMVTGPQVSAVEAESKVYPQCSDYRRTVVLIKGPGADTFTVDIFRVKGGKKHDYRLFSELAANDVKDGGVDFVGLDMPPDQPLPNYGGSTKREHVYGLIETRRATTPPSYWRAVWREPSMRHRLHMFTPASTVVESHGPGQERRELASQVGRRVRYVDVIREGENLTSAFVAIHEPSGADGALPILKAERLDVPAAAGTNAVALRIESKWGTYLVLSEFEQISDIAGIRFQGALGICCRHPGTNGWCFSVGAGTMAGGNSGVVGGPAWWEAQADSNTKDQITASSIRPADWSPDVSEIQNYVVVDDGQYWTGFPVQATGENVIMVKRFLLQKVNRFRLPAVRYTRGIGS